MSERSDALLLPADDAPFNAQLKKSVLFFDSVTLANVADAALINRNDVIEKFPEATIRWAERNAFPRNEGYVDSMQRIISDTSSLRSRGILRLTPEKPLPTMDAGVNYSLWHSAIADPILVNAAAPDRHRAQNPPADYFFYMRGGVMTINNHRSKYEIAETRPAFEFSDSSERWSMYAHLRLGRALKFLRISHAMGLIPLAFDDPNQKILAATGQIDAFVEQRNFSHSGDFSPIQFDLEIFDSAELISALDAMSWQDVASLRKEILPGMNRLRAHMRKVSILQNGDLSREENNKRLREMMLDFTNAKENLIASWEKLRIAALAKSGGAIGGEYLLHASGLLGTITGLPWIDLLGKIFAGGLIGAGVLHSEIQSLIPARRKVIQHKLYFTDRLPGGERP
ncbi:hypothetical protein [Herbaspirillum camelliae]|uniref:hypothetical protein n=1 Tax=Herbaspirillum camelliae TaxID=1892903 RepID=UPI000AB77A6C|nr:hypothetical protein [Herbaspirillum camelliae]